jgi:murein DD-endopeptidase MepM/ murein hydrolase activator NlpD
VSTAVDTSVPVPGQAQPPIWPLIIGGHGGFMEVRSSPADGACGVGTYPCKHPGIDVVGKPGTPVMAPEDGTIVFVADGSSSPVGGYGPWVVIIAGKSGRYHLLGHLEPGTSGMGPIGMPVRAGQQVGTVSSAYHTHWEVRTKAIPDFAHGESNATNNLDPVQWLREQGSAFGSLLLIGAAGLLFYLLWSR